MADVYLVSVLDEGEGYPLHEEAQRTGGYIVSDTQFVVHEKGLDPGKVSVQIKEQYGVEATIEPLTQELAEKFSETGLQEHIEKHWS